MAEQALLMVAPDSDGQGSRAVIPGVNGLVQNHRSSENIQSSHFETISSHRRLSTLHFATLRAEKDMA